MRASVIMFVAILLFVIGRWAHDKPAVSVQIVAAGAFLVIVVGLLDGGKTEPVAKGIAGLVLAVAVLNPDSPITAIADTINGKVTGNPTVTKQQQQIGRGGPGLAHTQFQREG